MRVLEVEDYAELSERAAELAVELLRAAPKAVVVPATGDTPMGMYADMVRRQNCGEVDLTGIRVFQLDEYVGIARDDPRSLFGWMERSFTLPLHVDPSNVVGLDGRASSLTDACRAYDAALESAGGIELAVLGLGPNGHLGYNEPPSAEDAPTREVRLTDESLQSAAAYFGGRQVPGRGLTCGMKNLLAARHLLLLVAGQRKRDILDRTMHGPLGPDVPASWLQRSSDVTVVADRAALGSACP